MLVTDAFDPHVYPEPYDLTNVQWQKLSHTLSRLLRSSFAQEAPAVLAPLVSLAERSGIAVRRTDRAIFTILQRIARSRTTFWRWGQEEWRALLSERAESRPYLAAVAYHFGRLRDPVMFAKPGLYAEVIFGSDLFLHELSRLRTVLRSLGYAEHT